ncbi:hypothetical protein H2200_008094 [Cladophialophora chaetospira]|uniref:Uncharacterized protein n=1 Tax=Cladophialophora chaetospira TaxID=386627 RepID=A0AA38X5B1_9EURO|nr:hypothetical protein H2200_008094 [Cladophialophora chaetospira]
MAEQSRYHITTIRKRRMVDDKVIERQEKIRHQSDEVRNALRKNHHEIQERTDQICAGKKMYEQEKRERLISGDKQKGPKAAHNARMREVETLFDLQSKQLSKLALCENRCLEPVNADERTALEQRWAEIMKPTEDILATISRQLG